MIIDCHGHYTAAPDALGRYRDAQRAELVKDPMTQGSKACSASRTSRSGTASSAPWTRPAYPTETLGYCV